MIPTGTAFAHMRDTHQTKRLNMQENEIAMQKALAQKTYIQIEKKFWGLKTNIIYKPTRSSVHSKYLEFEPQEGQLVQQILSAEKSELSSLCTQKVKPAANGKFRLYLCASQDGNFAAFQLSEYENFSFKPVSEIRFATGDEAQQILRFFM